MLSTRHAQFALVEICLPGEAPVPAGVVVLDPASGEHSLVFRRDWDEFAGDEAEVLSYLEDDFDTKLREMGPSEWLRRCQDSWSHTVRITDTRQVLASSDLQRTASRLYRQHVQSTVLPFQTHLPLYSARVAAGHFLEDNEVDAEDWLEMPADLRLDPRMFVVRITGRSMEPRIPDGSLCVFRAGVTGSRRGKLLLIERRDVSESGGRYTVKRYQSEIEVRDDERHHKWIRLEPLNREFEAWELEDDPDAFRVIGEFVRVLDSNSSD